MVGIVQRIRDFVDRLLWEVAPQDMPAAIGEIARAKAVMKARLLTPDVAESRVSESAGPPDPLVLVPELAKILGISEHQVYLMHRSRELPTLKIRRRIAMRQSTLRHYLEQRERIAGH